MCSDPQQYRNATVYRYRKKELNDLVFIRKTRFFFSQICFLGSIKCAREGVIEHCSRSPFFKAEAHVGTSLRNRVSVLFYSHISYNSICYTLDFKQVACIKICMPHKNWLNFQKFRINFVCLCDSLYCK